MTANAEIVLEEHKNVLTVPEQALIYDTTGKAFIEVPDTKAKEGKRRVSVQAGISNGTRTELLNGLKQGDSVVLQQ
jgi:HlyD family secretion protein